MSASGPTHQLNDKERVSLLRAVLQSFCPPQRLLVFIGNRILGQSAEYIVREFFDHNAGAIEKILQAALIASAIPEDLVRRSFQEHHRNWDWEKTLKELLPDKEGNPAWLKNPGLKEVIVNEIKLKSFFVRQQVGEAHETGASDESEKFMAPVQELIDYWNKGQELKWIAEAHQGNQRAFERLYRVYEKQVFGYIRARTRNDDAARIIATNTWTEIWTKFEAFNPAFSAFVDFVKNRAFFNRMRYLHPRLPKDGQTSGHSMTMPIHDLDDSTILAPDTADDDIIRDLDRKRLYGILFKLAFGSAGPPHELITFGLRDLRAIAVKEIVTQHAGKKLRLLTNSLEEYGPGITDLPKARVQLYLQPLREKLDKPFKDLKIHKKTKDQYLKLYELITGETMLRQYFIGDQEADFWKNLADWCRNTQRRVRAAVTPAERLEYADAI